MFRMFLFVCLLALASCGKEDPATIVEINSTPFFPLKQGLRSDFDVLEIAFSQEGRRKDSLRYSMRSSIIDRYEDDNGNDIFLIDRLTKKNEASDWQLESNWTVKICKNEVIETQDNVPMLKMILPHKKSVEWNPLKYYDGRGSRTIGGETIEYYKNWEAKVTEINGSWNGFLNVTTIELVNFENRLERRYVVEKYAQDIGLIHREIMIVDTQCFENCQQKPWLEKAEKGHYILQTIKK